MKYLFSLTIFLLFMSSAVLGQNPSAEKYPHRKLDRLQSFLNLTNVQVEQLKTELAELKAEKTPHRQAMQEAMKRVLSPKQMDKLHSKEAWKKHRKPRKHMWHRADGEVREKLKDMRVDLEDYITDEDRETINILRQARADFKEKYRISKSTFKELSTEEREERRAAFNERRHQSNPAYEKARALAEKYSPEIVDIFKENETFFMEMKAAERSELQEGPDVKHCQDCDCSPVPKESDELGKAYGMHKRIAFLLMDTSSEALVDEPIEARPNTIVLYPNPTADQTQITFEVRTAADISLDIRDEQGRLMETLISQYYEEGSYTKDINTRTYESGVYFVSFYDGMAMQTEKLIIQK